MVMDDNLNLEGFPRPSWYQHYGKRSIDIVLVLIIVMLTWPLMVVCSGIIRLDTPGPVLYRQQRIGYRGKIFTLYKFRTMIDHADDQQGILQGLNEASGPFFKIKADPRITKSGHWLRMYSVDELPQLWNVIKGDMSLVGPRPILQLEMAEFEPWMYERFRVKPGITGLWQVTEHKNNLAFSDWIKRDIRYVQAESFRLDWWILWQTLKVIWKQENE